MEEQELTAAEEAAIREAAYNGESEPETASIDVEAVEPEPEPEAVDPWAGVPTALRSQIEMISGRLNGLGEIENRLKQTEKRLGGIQNDFYNSQKKAAEVPTATEVAKAAKSSESWENLKTEFPDWADAIEGKIAEKNANIPDIESLRAKVIELENRRQVAQESPEDAVRYVEAWYPNFREIIRSSDYQRWLQTQPEIIRKDAETSQSSSKAVAILDRYERSRNKTETIAASNKQKLEQAVDFPKAPKAPAKKSVEDMSEAEIRQQIQKELWGT